MKKLDPNQLPRLHLNRLTLLTLSRPDDLQRVAGGAETYQDCTSATFSRCSVCA
jgi:hypothetical protein